MNATTTPDGLNEWTARRHGAGHPNTPRPLTSATVKRVPDGGINVHGDNGTSRILSGDADTPLARAARAVLNAVSDAPVEDAPAAPSNTVPPGSLITITIGRNTPSGAPLSDVSWRRFVRLTYTQVTALLGGESKVFGPFYGSGEWDGVPEESATVTILVGPDATGGRVSAITGVLADLADDYAQDAVAWSYGPSILARPAR